VKDVEFQVKEEENLLSHKQLLLSLRSLFSLGHVYRTATTQVNKRNSREGPCSNSWNIASQRNPLPSKDGTRVFGVEDL
jgi:hypothetical protein